MSIEFDLEYEEAVSGAEQNFKNISSQEINKFLLALLAVRRVANKLVDSFNLKLHFEAAKRSGKFSESSFIELVHHQEKFVSPPEGDAKNIVRRLRDVGGSAVKTGHYRRLTISHIQELIQASRAHTFLVLLLESGERTYKFKHKEIELTDAQRLRMFELSGLVNGGVYLIGGNKYNHKYYEGLLKEWSPAFYLGNESWSERQKIEGRRRACRSKSTFVELGCYTSSISTTRMENMILI